MIESPTREAAPQSFAQKARAKLESARNALGSAANKIGSAALEVKNHVRLLALAAIGSTAFAGEAPEPAAPDLSGQSLASAAILQNTSSVANAVFSGGTSSRTTIERGADGRVHMTIYPAAYKPAPGEEPASWKILKKKHAPASPISNLAAQLNGLYGEQGKTFYVAPHPTDSSKQSVYMKTGGSTFFFTPGKDANPSADSKAMPGFADRWVARMDWVEQTRQLAKTNWDLKTGIFTGVKTYSPASAIHVAKGAPADTPAVLSDTGNTVSVEDEKKPKAPDFLDLPAERHAVLWQILAKANTALEKPYEFCIKGRWKRAVVILSKDPENCKASNRATWFYATSKNGEKYLSGGAESLLAWAKPKVPDAIAHTEVTVETPSLPSDAAGADVSTTVKNTRNSAIYLVDKPPRTIKFVDDLGAYDYHDENGQPRYAYDPRFGNAVWPVPPGPDIIHTPESNAAAWKALSESMKPRWDEFMNYRRTAGLPN